MRRDDSLYDRQAIAGAVLVLRESLLEHLVAGLGWNARPVVFDEQSTAVERPDTDVRGPAVVGDTSNRGFRGR